MEIHHLALREELRFVCAEIIDGIDVRECLHAELTVETASQCVENLIFLLSAVPYIPLMQVSHRWVRSFSLTITPRTSWMVSNVWALGCNHFRQNLLIY